MPAREELLSLPVVVLASNPETILGDIFRINASVGDSLAKASSPSFIVSLGHTSGRQMTGQPLAKL